MTTVNTHPAECPKCNTVSVTAVETAGRWLGEGLFWMCPACGVPSHAREWKELNKRRSWKGRCRKAAVLEEAQP